MFDVWKELRIIDDDQFGVHRLCELPATFESQQVRLVAPDDFHRDIEIRERASRSMSGSRNPLMNEAGAKHAPG